ncbi:MAG TPA: SRPBCC domain-containing protein [Amycolatopsis sp.]|jgi:uncharacterized protein YndB with AHSA1/START domain|nr:SRPBCC domain-containing protein [Amycolatopsis sp.]
MPEQRFSKTIPRPVTEVWAAITAERQPWYFNSAFVGPRRAGEPFRYEKPDGSITYIDGILTEFVPPRRMVQEFRFTDLEDAPTTVVWEVAEEDGHAVVTLLHDFPEITATYKRTKGGWPRILDSLEAILVRGKLPLLTRVQNALLGPVIRLSSLTKKS